MGAPEMERVAGLMATALRGRDDEAILAGVRAEVHDLCRSFPPYPELRRPEGSTGSTPGS
jgi:glycine/serine hydroxymethyltransferase